MFFIGEGADTVTDDHEGFVAGRYRDGSASDIWTSVARCAHGTFVGYCAACECGWAVRRLATPYRGGVPAVPPSTLYRKFSPSPAARAPPERP
jgi:hypothetical protein